MNRDCNIEELAYESQSGDKIVRLSDLQDWLTNKKVIKKGLQPHPYADVLHEWVEGVPTEARELGEKWTELFFSPLEYRTKLQEPVYETMWYDTDGKTKWFTDDEANEQICYTFKARETKRLRQ